MTTGVGFQFCGFFRREQKIDELAAVRSYQMTSRSRQTREPPRFVVRNLVYERNQ